MATSSRTGGAVLLWTTEEERKLYCAICLSLMREPRLLPCSHAYCLQCLSLLVPNNKTEVQCPTCRREFELPAEGVQGLSVAPRLEQMVQRVKQRRRDLKKEKTKQMCADCHTKRQCQGCPHCAMPVCVNCVMTHIQDIRTEILTMTNKLLKLKKQLQLELLDHPTSFTQSSKKDAEQKEPLRKCSSSGGVASKDTKRLLSTLTRALSSSRDLGTKIQTHSSQPFNELESLTHQHVFLSKLITSLNNRLSKPVKRSNTQIKHGQNTLTASNNTSNSQSSLDSADSGVDSLGELRSEQSSSTDTRMKSSSKKCLRSKSVGRTSGARKYPFESTKDDSSVHLGKDNSLLTYEQNLPPDFLNIDLSEKILHDSQKSSDIVSYEQELSIQTKCKPKKSVLFLKSNKEETSKHPIMETSDNSSDMKNANGNSFEALEEQSLFYRCKPSRSQQKLKHKSTIHRPTDVAWCPWNRAIYVTVSQLSKVFVYPEECYSTHRRSREHKATQQVSSNTNDVERVRQRSFGVRGNSEGLLLCPQAVACSPVVQELYVLDKWRSVLLVFTLDGHFLREFGSNDRGHSKLNSPEGLAVDQKGLLYLADTCNDRVLVMDREGSLLREIGSRHLLQPAGVAVSSTGDTILVADTGNHRCRVYSGVTGQLLKTFGIRGPNQGQMQAPECVALDPLGYMFVGDSGNNRIQVFRPNGNFVRYFGTRNGHNGELELVTGLIITPLYDVIAVDFAHSNILVY